MGPPDELDPRDRRLLETILDALVFRVGQDASVADGFGSGLAAKADYAIFVCSRPGGWAAEVLAARGAHARCRVTTGVRLAPDQGSRHMAWRDVSPEVKQSFDPSFADFPEPAV